MFRVMLIDDERAIRGLLKALIDWQRFSMELVGEASSGIEAINIIDELKPDIVFVDIKMPFMNGIDFTHLALERYPNIKIIILTAFSDFNYARQCIGIGICSYILKPINPEEIHEVLKKIHGQLQAAVPLDEEQLCSPSADTAGRIKNYILQNYTEPDLNLTSTAHAFGLNASYVSRLFKSSYNQSFVDFLLSCRMEKALLLATQKRFLYQTAAEVGIPDPNYFSRCFKKYTGKNYSEFLKQ